MIIVAILTMYLSQTYAIREYELSGNFEGDMILSPQQQMVLDGSSDGRARNAIAYEEYRWPDATVPYRINTEDFTKEQVDYIRKAMDEIESVSCVRFVEAAEDADEAEYVEITGSRPGCVSSVGYQRKKQTINYQPNDPENGCFYLVALMHEMLHTLGFFHMQSAPERDDYLIIMWENIKEGQMHNFKKFNASAVTGFNVDYDYDSIMHYGSMAFSANGEPTMIPTDESIELGRHQQLSEGDITKINRMYNCE